MQEKQVEDEGKEQADHQHNQGLTHVAVAKLIVPASQAYLVPP